MNRVSTVRPQHKDQVRAAWQALARAWTAEDQAATQQAMRQVLQAWKPLQSDHVLPQCPR